VEAVDADPAGWYLLRLPTARQLARRRGFPADRVDNAGMRAWCESRCRGGWLERPTDERGSVFLFERRDEAVAFALRWFPFKCG
jgi:hypothetical protein